MNTTRRYFFRLLVASLFAISASVSLGQSKSPFHGVWIGSVGKATITACLNDDSDRVVQAGLYYYQKYKIPIALSIDKRAQTSTISTWRESDGIWQIHSNSPDYIEGTWTSVDQARRLPVRLKRAAYTQDDLATRNTPCGSDAFNQAIEQSLKKWSGAIVSNGAIRYRIVTYALPSGPEDSYKNPEQSWETVELIGNAPAIKALNKSIRQLLEGSWSFGCRRMGLNLSMTEGTDTQRVDVRRIENWFSVTQRVVYDCRNGISISDVPYVWSLTTGKQESLFSWLKNVSSAQRDEPPYTDGKLPPALDAFLATQFGKGNPNQHLSLSELEQCYGPYEPGSYSYQIELDSDGLRFNIPTNRNGSCGESFKLTFQELKPFLNKKGLQFAAKIQAGQKAKR
jgi:hypothetical protein